MKLSEELAEYIGACFTGIWIETFEPEEALREIAELCREQDWELATWDIHNGLGTPGASSQSANDPLAALQVARQMAGNASLLTLTNFHRFLGSAEIVQAVAAQIERGKQQRTFLVILAPVVDLPKELEKRFVVIEHHLPDREQLRAIASETATEPGEFPTDEAELQQILDAAAGLTRMEAEGAFSLSLVRHGRLDAETIYRVKGQQLKKSGLLTLHDGPERFDQLGGLAALKSFCQRVLRPTTTESLASPKGILLVSPPGCGKSAFCKSLGNEVGRPTLRLEMGALMGSLVGQSEANIRQAIAQAEAMAPCILMLDEIEKGLAGMSGGGHSDGGVATRMFGTLLSWLADRTSDLFVVATANRVNQLPPELTRAERFDGVFFVELPGRGEKDAIWQIHRRTFAIDAQHELPVDDEWTGAEIHSCCRLSRLLGVSLVEAAQNIVPVAISAAESIGELRQWASGRCLDAERGGICRGASQQSAKRRGISMRPSEN